MPHVRRGEAGSRGGDSLVKFSVKLIWTFCILLTRHKHCLSVSVVTKPLTKKLNIFTQGTFLHVSERHLKEENYLKIGNAYYLAHK